MEEPLTVTDDMLAEAVPEQIDFERGMGYWPPATLSLIATLVAVFAWQTGTHGLESTAALVDSGALVRNRVLEGESWRMISSTMLHGGFGHLLGNCVALYILGLAGEHALGAWRMLALYVASGLAGSLASILAGPGPSVGASGAICGLMGGVILILYRYRRVYHVRDKEIAIVIATWAAYTIVIGAIDPRVDNWAHFGGLLGGAVVALGLRPRVDLAATRSASSPGLPSAP